MKEKVDQKGFMNNFRYEPTALMNNLLHQNTRFKKSLDEIKQQKDELNKDERIVQIINIKMTDSI